MEKKDLAKMALAAFMLASTLPAAGQATGGDIEVPGSLIARGCGAGCGAATSNRAGCGAPSSNRAGCSAASSNRAGCGAASSNRAGCGASPSGHAGCGASTSSHACGASYPFPTSRPSSSSPNSNYNTTYETIEYTPSRPTSKSSNRPSSSNYDRMNMSTDTGDSSYQGTTTGPGPNGGYPGAPRGTYNPNTTNPSNYNR